MDSVHLPRSLPAGLSISAFENQCGVQEPIPASRSDQNTIRLSLSVLQKRRGLVAEQPAMISSTSQHDQPVAKFDMKTSIRKRPRTPQPTKAQRLPPVQHQPAKRTGVPEISLVCFGTEPRAKRHRKAIRGRTERMSRMLAVLLSYASFTRKR